MLPTPHITIEQINDNNYNGNEWARSGCTNVKHMLFRSEMAVKGGVGRR